MLIRIYYLFISKNLNAFVEIDLLARLLSYSDNELREGFKKKKKK